jgi:hypothetical protein
MQHPRTVRWRLHIYHLLTVGSWGRTRQQLVDGRMEGVGDSVCVLLDSCYTAAHLLAYPMAK